jgi:hypothetical protein
MFPQKFLANQRSDYILQFFFSFLMCDRLRGAALHRVDCSTRPPYEGCLWQKEVWQKNQQGTGCSGVTKVTCSKSSWDEMDVPGVKKVTCEPSFPELHLCLTSTRPKRFAHGTVATVNHLIWRFSSLFFCEVAHLYDKYNLERLLYKNTCGHQTHRKNIKRQKDIRKRDCNCAVRPFPTSSKLCGATWMGMWHDMTRACSTACVLVSNQWECMPHAHSCETTTFGRMGMCCQWNLARFSFFLFFLYSMGQSLLAIWHKPRLDLGDDKWVTTLIHVCQASPSYKFLSLTPFIHSLCVPMDCVYFETKGFGLPCTA